MKTVSLLFWGLGVIVVMIGVGWGVKELKYAGRIYPGVRVGNVDVGGLTSAQARLKLIRETERLNKIVLTWGGNKWEIGADKGGWNYEIDETITATMKAGRVGVWGGPKVVGVRPMLTWDENRLTEVVSSLALAINVPAREPEIKIEAGVIWVEAGENGQEVDERSLISAIKSVISSLGEEKIEIPVVWLRPKLSQAQVEAAKIRAEVMVGKTLKVNLPDVNEEWRVGGTELVTWIDPGGRWKKWVVEKWVDDLAEGVNRSPQNAQFRWINQERVEEFRPGKSGLTVMQEEMVVKLVEATNILEGGDKEAEVELIVARTKPEIDTGEINNLGIKELLGRGESFFTGSIENRVFNIKKASQGVNGVLVAPGEVFSFNHNLGDVSAATGYRQAYVIKQGKTVLGDGGGVCQVSSTLFRAALAAGLPIVERTAHAYRVSYYEQKSGPGFDATVFAPSPDFKFENDTGGFILVQAEVDEKNKHLVFEIYGTSDGRVVSISKPRIWEVTAPPPDLYQDDPTSPVGKIVQTEHSAWGAKAAFDWKVTRGDEVLQNRTFFSNYKPWQAVYLRGTKPN